MLGKSFLKLNINESTTFISFYYQFPLSIISTKPYLYTIYGIKTKFISRLISHHNACKGYFYQIPHINLNQNLTIKNIS